MLWELLVGLKLTFEALIFERMELLGFELLEIEIRLRCRLGLEVEGVEEEKHLLAANR